MIQRLRYLAGWAGARTQLAPGELDFGDVVAVLIVMIGLISFASTGLWAPP